MLRFCFKCRDCGAKFELYSREVPGCYECGGDLVRDYHAEMVGVGSGVRASRDGTLRDQAKLFLPDNSEFKGPGDPDGKKGARQWLETHRPKHPGGRNPLLEVEKKVF